MRRRFGILLTAGLAFMALAFSQGVANASVSSTPALTPQLATSGIDGTVEQIRQQVVCNNGPGGAPIVYAVGLFTNVKQANSTAIVVRKNAFAYAATASPAGTPLKITTWDPEVNGQVDTVACAPDGSVLLGGVFTTVGTTTTGIRNIARVDAATGAAQPFTPSPVFGGRVAHIEVIGTRALVGGYFPGYLRSINPLTGASDNYINGSTVNIPITGSYVYTGVSPNATRVWNMAVSPDQSAVLLMGDFTKVGGWHHEQIVRINLGTTPTVSGWAPTELYLHCATVEPFYAQDAAWSPDMTKIYTATTGYKLYNDTSPRSHARTGPCDAALAYQATSQTEFASHTWVNYTGCDSLFAVAADASTVYIAGHERYIDNPNDCDHLGIHGRAQPGLGELNPATGASVPGPSRGRGLGADDLLLNSYGLWIASDNQANTSTCSSASGRMGICMLPTA